MKKIAYKGDLTEETGRKIIKALEELGGNNNYSLLGNSNTYYFNTKDGILIGSAFIPDGYTLNDFGYPDNKRLKHNLYVWFSYSIICYIILIPFEMWIKSISIALLLGFQFGLLNSIITNLRKLNN